MFHCSNRNRKINNNDLFILHFCINKNGIPHSHLVTSLICIVDEACNKKKRFDLCAHTPMEG